MASKRNRGLLMKNNLVIVFVKNILLGKVKTRLAKSIGDWGAFEVYKYLVEITERETGKIQNADLRIYFSDIVIDSKWNGHEKFVQEGESLGQRMRNAFEKGFEDGYENIVGIGSDLPDLNEKIISEGLKALDQHQTVFGPAKDGGYYLLGMNEIYPLIFENKPWSQPDLLKRTLEELKAENISTALLTELNDIDTLEDLKNSSIANKFVNHYDIS